MELLVDTCTAMGLKGFKPQNISNFINGEEGPTWHPLCVYSPVSTNRVRDRHGQAAVQASAGVHGAAGGRV
jgi:hypothetical protein